jgi:hypothetical protein
MGVPGITIYHVKSHLQKYRLAKYIPESPAEGSKDEKKDSSDSLSNTDSAPGMQINEALKMQMEVQKRLHEQLEVCCYKMLTSVTLGIFFASFNLSTNQNFL